MNANKILPKSILGGHYYITQTQINKHSYNLQSRSKGYLWNWSNKIIPKNLF